MTTFDRLKPLIIDVLGCAPEKITLDAHLTDDLGADDLDRLEIVMKAEEEFNVELDDALIGLVTLKEVVDAIDVAINKKAAA